MVWHYITHPENDDRVIWWDDDIVVIRDKYPKARLHWLVLPRDLKLSVKHPLTGLADNSTHDRLQPMIDNVLDRAAEELAKQLQPAFAEVARSYLRAGVHSIPSLDNVHIHIISKDMDSPSMRHAKHYNSFTTPFFVEYEGIPVIGSDQHDSHHSSRAMHALLARSPLICPWCHEDFGRSFVRLKEHLSYEASRRFVE